MDSRPVYKHYIRYPKVRGSGNSLYVVATGEKLTCDFPDIGGEKFHLKAHFFKYGLFRDDVLVQTPAVEEAIRRLPDAIHDDRVRRIRRAIDLIRFNETLPEEQWIKLEDDLKNRYLEPYIEKVEREQNKQKA